jgi:hypothetical protein
MTAPAAQTGQRFPQPLLANATAIAASHRDTHGDNINPNQLAVRCPRALWMAM